MLKRKRCAPVFRGAVVILYRPGSVAQRVWGIRTFTPYHVHFYGGVNPNEQPVKLRRFKIEVGRKSKREIRRFLLGLAVTYSPTP